MSDQQKQKQTPTRNPGMEAMADQSENEAESALRMEEGEQPKFNTFPSSVYSLTLDEFQNNLTGIGRNYGSMNMDEFLQSIWSAEENEALGQNVNIAMPTVAPVTSVTNISPHPPNQFCETSNQSPRQLGLTRQGSFSVPASLCQRTVKEVWSEINRTQQNTNNSTHAGSKQSDPPAYGEMTLEDFLVRAGVVREERVGRAQPPPPFHPPQLPQLQPHPQSQLPCGLYVNCDGTTASNFMILGSGGVGSVNVYPPFQALPQIGGANVAACLLSGKSSGSAYQPATSYGGGLPENGCGTESFEKMSPISSDGIGMSKRGRKRDRGGPVERVFEGREKRMIKNRESAARSRERKNAYTIELEMELNHLKDENANLRHRLTELGTRSVQQNTEAAKANAQAKGKDKLGLLRRCLSSPF